MPTSTALTMEFLAKPLVLVWMIFIAGAAILPILRVHALVPRLDADGSFVVGPYRTTFRCPRGKYGYYADVDNDCRLFHICNPRRDVRQDSGLSTTSTSEHFSFICPRNTIFDQLTYNCATREQAAPCSHAVDFYFFKQEEEEESSDDNPLVSNFVNDEDTSSAVGDFETRGSAQQDTDIIVADPVNERHFEQSTSADKSLTEVAVIPRPQRKRVVFRQRQTAFVNK